MMLKGDCDACRIRLTESQAGPSALQPESPSVSPTSQAAAALPAERPLTSPRRSHSKVSFDASLPAMQGDAHAMSLSVWSEHSSFACCIANCAVSVWPGLCHQALQGVIFVPRT